MAPLPIAILGAGPAGMACADALLSFGLTPVVIERSAEPGGAQRGNFHPNLWLLGTPAESGEAMTARMTAQFRQLPIAVHAATEVTAVRRAAAGFVLDLAGPDAPASLTAAAIVLCTGMRPRATPELTALAGQSARVLIGPLAPVIRDGIRAGRVLILGGGDNAFDHALFLAERGNRIVVCARSAFSARAGFQAACAGRPDIELRPHCRADALQADAAGIRLLLAGRPESFDWLLVLYGYQPNTEGLAAFAADIRPALSDGGHIEVDRAQRTSVAGVYAAGDVTETVQPAVATAIAQGLAAARTVERDLRGGAQAQNIAASTSR